jgi:acetyl esterase/lipase
MMNARTMVGLAAAGAVAGLLVSGACHQPRERDAEARAKRWGFPAVEIVRDLEYARYGQRRLKLDVYLPPKFDRSRSVPGIVVVRGGAFRSGDKEFFGYIAGQLAMQGFVAASIEYRTVYEARFPAPVHDVKAAVRWLRAHAQEYGIDAYAIGAIGGSAGAYLVSMLAAGGGRIELEGDGGNAGVSSDVQAVVAMGGAYNLEWKDVNPEFVSAVRDFLGEPSEARAAVASPARYVNSRSAPLLLLHSRTDPVAPFGQAVEMQQRYRQAGASVLLKAIDAPGVHGFWGSPHYFPEAKVLAVEFFRRTLSRARP